MLQQNQMSHKLVYSGNYHIPKQKLHIVVENKSGTGSTLSNMYHHMEKMREKSPDTHEGYIQTLLDCATFMFQYEKGKRWANVSSQTLMACPDTDSPDIQQDQKVQEGLQLCTDTFLKFKEKYRITDTNSVEHMQPKKKKRRFDDPSALEWMCVKCATTMGWNAKEASLVCTTCGLSTYEGLMTSTQSSLGYEEYQNRQKYRKSEYKHETYLKRCIRQRLCQGRSVIIPDRLITMLREYFEKTDIPWIYISPSHVKWALSELAFPNYYPVRWKITQALNSFYVPPSMSETLVQQLVCILKCCLRLMPKATQQLSISRAHFLSYPLFCEQSLLRLGFVELSEAFSDNLADTWRKTEQMELLELLLQWVGLERSGRSLHNARKHT